MLILEELTVNELNIELVPTIEVPYWYFVWSLDDMNGNIVELFITPTYISDRFYTFAMDTTANPLKSGELTLRVYELADNTPSPDVSDLVPSYVSKARIYVEDSGDTYHTINLEDERID